ncbi:MAG: ABC transporter permease [bacterium]
MPTSDGGEKQEARLPRIAAAILSALIPRAERDELLHDLASEFGERASQHGSLHAHLWCWRQIISSTPSLINRSWWRGRTGFEPRANAMQPGGPAMEQWIMDARHALRRLIRRPRYAMLAILTLALGIGGTAAIFGVARGIFFDPLPYTNAESIALFSSPFDWNQQEFTFLRGNTPGFSQIAQYTNHDVTLETGDGPARIMPGIAASSELFSVLGARPLRGRTFQSTDDVQGAEAVVVISYGLWQELGGSDAILQQRIRLGGIPTTVIGVMPRGFWFPSPTVRVWVPQQLNPTEHIGNFALVGRVAPGQSIETMQPAIAKLGAMLRERFTYTKRWDKTQNASVQSVREAIVAPLRPTLLATFVAMGMILLIACANVASLMLGQVEGRTTELAVRTALGATRARLTRQLIGEAVILGAIAGAVGAVFAGIVFRSLVASMPLGAWAETASLDWRVFAMAMIIAVGAALTISLAPTLALWRGRLREVIGAGRTQGVARRGVRLESMLVVAEVAIAVLMTSGAGLLVRSVQNLYAINPGVESRGVGVVDVVLPTDVDDDRRKVIVRNLIAGVRDVPGVKSAAVVQRLPLRGGGWNSGITIEGMPDLERSTTFTRIASPDYLATMGVAVKKGRIFEESDMAVSPTDSSGGVIVINEALAKKYFGTTDPIGRRMGTGFGPTLSTVIGVVGDVAEGNLTDAAAPARYMPYTRIPFMVSGQTIVFRVDEKQTPVALLPAVRAALIATDPRVAIQEATTMEQVLALAVGPARQILTLVALLTVLALLLGAIGIYGVMSHFVARRQRDWGIRIALGLSPVRVLSGVVGHSTSLVGVGIALGLIGFLVLARLLTSLIYGVGAADPLTIGASIAALLVTGVVAALLPALRASRTDPAVALREQ